MPEPTALVGSKASREIGAQAPALGHRQAEEGERGGRRPEGEGRGHREAEAVDVADKADLLTVFHFPS